MRGARAALVVFIHSSNEMFGADRMLLQVVDSLASVSSARIEVWLPSDASVAPDSVAAHLTARGVLFNVVDLPILRRRNLTPRGVVALLAKAVALSLRFLRARPSLVYCSTSAGLLAAPIARATGCRHVLLHQQEIWSGLEAKALGMLASFCTSAIAISRATQASLVGPVRSRSIVIPNAIRDMDSSPVHAAGSEEWRTLTFLVASRWNSWKGHRTLLAAWNSLDPPPGRLLVLGSAPSEGIGVDVPALVASLRHPSSVEIIGQVNEITPWVDRADVVIVPSDGPEPFGLVAIEAFRRGRPVIASRQGGIGEVVASGFNGVLFGNRSSVDLADAFRSLSHRQVERFGINARHTFERRYSIERFDRSFAAVWSALGLTAARA